MDSQLLKKLPLFSHLNQQDLALLADSLETKLYLKNKIVFQESQPADELYIVLDGLVKISRIGIDGKEHILHLMPKNSIIAEVPIFEGTKYPANCIAICDTILLAIPRQKFIYLIKNDPQIALNMLTIQAKRLKEFTAKIEQLSSKNTKQKLMNFLLENSSYEHGKKIAKLKQLSLQELANYIGTARENLSRIINKLISDKIIEKHKEGFLIK